MNTDDILLNALGRARGDADDRLPGRDEAKWVEPATTAKSATVQNETPGPDTLSRDRLPFMVGGVEWVISIVSDNGSIRIQSQELNEFISMYSFFNDIDLSHRSDASSSILATIAHSTDYADDDFVPTQPYVQGPHGVKWWVRPCDNDYPAVRIMANRFYAFTIFVDNLMLASRSPLGLGDSYPLTRRDAAPDQPTTRTVPSLSGEFPGLGKWTVGLDKWQDLDFKILTGFLWVRSNEILWLNHKPYKEVLRINDWHTRLSALPPREVVGDYVIGPYDVRFQMETHASHHISILGNGYTLVQLTPKDIFIPVKSPLFDHTKSGADQSWQLRGEG